MYAYIYIYIHIYTFVCIYIYTHIHIQYPCGISESVWARHSFHHWVLTGPIGSLHSAKAWYQGLKQSSEMCLHCWRDSESITAMSQHSQMKGRSLHWSSPSNTWCKKYNVWTDSTDVNSLTAEHLWKICSQGRRRTRDPVSSSPMHTTQSQCTSCASQRISTVYWCTGQFGALLSSCLKQKATRNTWQLSDFPTYLCSQKPATDSATKQMSTHRTTDKDNYSSIFASVCDKYSQRKCSIQISKTKNKSCMHPVDSYFMLFTTVSMHREKCQERIVHWISTESEKRTSLEHLWGRITIFRMLSIRLLSWGALKVKHWTSPRSQVQARHHMQRLGKNWEVGYL